MTDRLVDGSLEDAKEVLENAVKPEDNTDVPTFTVSPRYKGKNPKTPEELAKIREQKKAKRMAGKTDGLYESADKMVSHPSHYQVGKYEALDIIQEATKDLTGIFAVDTSQALKYILRWNKKGTPKRDVEKAIFYLTHLVRALDESEMMMRECYGKNKT